MKLGFIGCGNMASAIISGTVKSGTVAGSDIYAFNPTETKVNMLAEKFGINSCKSGVEVADICDYIVLSVKPNVLAGVLNEIAGNVVGNGKVLISIAAGKSIDFIAENLNSDEKIVRVMPNINAVVSESCSAYCANSLVSENEKAEVEKLFFRSWHNYGNRRKHVSAFRSYRRLLACICLYVYRCACESRSSARNEERACT